MKFYSTILGAKEESPRPHRQDAPAVPTGPARCNGALPEALADRSA